MTCHTVTRLQPSLAPIECDGADLSKLSGTRVRAEAKLFKNGEIHRERRWKFNSLSLGSLGICIFNLSKMMRFGTRGDTFQALRLCSICVGKLI